MNGVVYETRSAPGRLVAGLLAVWAVLVLGAMGGLWKYKSTPGAPVTAPGEILSRPWLAREPGRDTLLFFAHPRCACTRASLGELRVIMSELGARVSATVLFFVPEREAAGWTSGESWSLASSIPGVRVLQDPGGAEARAFGAHTSGSVLLYGGDGRLLFDGGITAARGHEGDNPGRDEIVRIARGSVAKVAPTPVFGCSIAEQR